MTTDRKPDAMHDRLARRSQRHAAQRRPVEAQRRIETLETLLHITQERMIADSLLLGTTSTHRPERIAPAAPEGHPESLTAELPEAQEIALAALSNDLWPHDEYLEITPDGDLLPVMDGPVFTCWCGAQSSGGSCPLGHRS